MSEPKGQATLYQRLTEIGAEMSSHESDLYVKSTDETKAIVENSTQGENASTFRSEIDGTLWIDIPFAYDPWWDNRKSPDTQEATMPSDKVETKRKWVIIQEGDDAPYIEQVDGEPVATMFADWGMIDDETKSVIMEDARLIAAAPEMYAVLKKWDRFMQDNYTPEEMSWWDETRRALAKAEKEE